MAEAEYTIEQVYQALSNAGNSDEDIREALLNHGYSDDDINSVIPESDDEEDEDDTDITSWDRKEKAKDFLSKEEKNSLLKAFSELREHIYDMEKRAEGKQRGEDGFFEQVAEPLADTDTIRSIFADIEGMFNRPNLMNDFSKKELDIMFFSKHERILDRLEELPDEIVNEHELNTLAEMSRDLLVSIKNFMIDGKSKRAYINMTNTTYKESTSNNEDKSSKELIADAMRKM